MTNYDAWLEKPYQVAYAQEDAYVAWCEDNDLDPTEGDHTEAFQQAQADAEDDYYSDLAEAQAEDARFDCR